MTLLKLVFLEGQRAHQPSSGKPKGSGIQPKTVPELGIGESPLTVHHYHLRTTLTQLNDRRLQKWILPDWSCGLQPN